MVFVQPLNLKVLIIYSRIDFAYLHCPKDLYMQPFCLKYKVNKNKKKRENRRDKIKMATRISTLWLILAR